MEQEDFKDGIEQAPGISMENIPKLQPDWEKAPSLADLKLDHTDAKSDHDTHVAQVDIWLDNLNTTGTAKPKVEKGKSAVVPKVIRKAAEWRYSSLSEPFLDTPDIFNTDPVTYEDKLAAIQNGLVINHQFNTKLKKIDLIDEYIRTGVDEGTVIVYVGWEAETEEFDVPVYEPQMDYSDDTMQRMSEISILAQQNPEQMQQVPEEWRMAFQASIQTGQPHHPVEIATETETKYIKNQPDIEMMDYHNVIIDPTCQGDLDKAGFIIRTFESSTSDLKKDGRYENLDYIDLSLNDVMMDDEYKGSKDTGGFNYKDKARKKFVVHEYWGYWDIDGDGTTTAIVASWVGNVMIHLDLNPMPEGKLPFVRVQYLPVRKSVYGQPDGYLIEDNQKIIGAVSRGMLDIMARAAAGQRGYRKDALDITNQRKFKAGIDYEYNASADPTTLFHTHKFEEIPQSAQIMLALQNADAESLTGVKAFSSGINSGELGDSVGGIGSVLDATAKREMGILRRFGEGMKQIARKVVAMNAVFLDDEEVVRITNEQFVRVRRDDLAGEIDIRISISTAEANAAKAQELAFMLQTLGQDADFGMRKILLTDIARLRKMPELAKSLENYEPQPDPIQQALAEAEVELKRLEVQKVGEEILLTKAKTELERAKANQQDLATVEQETGTTHARAQDLAGAQADSNMERDLVKAAVDLKVKKEEPKPAQKK